MKLPALQLIRFYQRYLSLDTGILRFIFPTARVCRFTPRCSEYMYLAIETYGILKGINMGILRILRCHPWNPGGYDPLKKHHD